MKRKLLSLLWVPLYFLITKHKHNTTPRGYLPFTGVPPPIYLPTPLYTLHLLATHLCVSCAWGFALSGYVHVHIEHVHI